MSDDVLDVVQRVDRATLPEMRNVDIDDVYVQMDYVLQQRATPMDLYHRWESQNWSTQDLDFSEDAQQWASMEGFFEGIRTELQRSLAPKAQGAQDNTRFRRTEPATAGQSGRGGSCCGPEASPPDRPIRIDRGFS